VLNNNLRFLPRRNLYVTLCLLNLIAWGPLIFLSQKYHFAILIYLLLLNIKEMLIMHDRSKNNKNFWIYYDIPVQSIVSFILLALLSFFPIYNMGKIDYVFGFLSLFVILINLLIIFLGEGNTKLMELTKPFYVTGVIFLLYAISLSFRERDSLFSSEWIWSWSIGLFTFVYLFIIAGKLKFSRNKSAEESLARFIMLYYLILALIGFYKDIQFLYLSNIN